MRPHRLTIKGFGPFAKETVIDFDQLGNGIFLISGETGSGKTMIFDALVYALYGMTSGERRDELSIASYLSDFGSAEDKKAMKVALTFSEGGKTYTVERALERKRTNLHKSAFLKCGEDLLVQNKDNNIGDGTKLVQERSNKKGNEEKSEDYKEDKVTAKIAEMLNLNANQFRQIVLLAQGEFQKFLTAKADERGKILGKLYDNRRHTDLEKRLKDAENKLNDSQRKLKVKMQQALDTCNLPDGLRKELNPKIKTTGECIGTLREMIKKDKQEQEKIKQELKEKQQEKEKLIKEKTDAEHHNKTLDALDEAQKEQKRLNDQKDGMEKLAAQIGLTEKAGKVCPAEKRCREAEEALSKANKDLEKLKEEKQKLENEAAAIDQKREDLKKLRQQKTSLATAISDLENNALTLYPKIEEQTVNQKQAEGKLENLADREKDLNTKKEKNDQEKTQNRQTLDRLRNAGEAAVAIAKQKVDDLKNRGQKLRELKDGKEGLKKKADYIRRIIEKEEKHAEAEKKYAAAVEAHQKLNKAFLSGQAVLLANDLRDEIAKSGQAVCPVCGQHHTMATIAGKAVAAGQVPAEAEVNEAEKNVRAAQAEAKERYTELEAEKAAAEVFGNSLREKTAELGLTVEEKTGLPTLEETEKAFNQCCADYKKAEADLKEAEAKKTKKETAEKKAGELESEGKKYIQEAESLQEKKDAANKALTEATTTLEGYRKTLQDKNYPADEAVAKKQLAQGQRDLQTLEVTIGETDSKIQKYDQELSAIGGNIDNAVINLKDRKGELDTAQDNYRTALDNNGFDAADGEVRYRKALNPEGKPKDQSLDNWLKDCRKKLADYDKQKTALETTIGNLQKELAGKKIVRQELGDFVRREKELKEIIGRREADAEEINSRLGINEKAVSQMEGFAKEQLKNDRCLEAVAPLVDSGRKIKFSEYVLKDFFQQVICQANGYFQTMIGGQYEIIPVEEGAATSGKNLSLGLQYRNIIAEKIHDCASLSGGQSFEASLALALGLSAVVQMENAGAISIDSMYIDEGFGTLSKEDLNNAIKVLESIAESDRQIGIISHVEELEKTLSNKIIVTKTENGSTIELQTDLRA